MKKLIITGFLAAITLSVFPQTIYMTRSGQVSFLSKTSLEDIEGVNNEVTSLLNADTGEIAFAILIKSFRFEKALMEEHFNENYMESTKLPKSTFQGKITYTASVDFTKDGTYPVSVEGDLTIHGGKRHITANGTAVKYNGKVSINAKFTVIPADYKIEIHPLVEEKIAKIIEVNVNCQYEPKM